MLTPGELPNLVIHGWEFKATENPNQSRRS